MSKTVLVAGPAAGIGGPSVGAKTIVKAIHARRPRMRYAVGGGAGLLSLLRSPLTDRAFDALMRMFVRQEPRS
jgi:hypothetical protein